MRKRLPPSSRLQGKLSTMKAAIGTSTPAQPSGRTAVTHSKEFADLIKCIGECRSKQEEDRIMMQEVTALKKIFASPNLDKTKTREYLLRLVYVEMLGNDAAFAYINVVNACGEKNWVMKKVSPQAGTGVQETLSSAGTLRLTILICNPLSLRRLHATPSRTPLPPACT